MLKLGKRYRCGTCGIEVLVTKAGDCTLRCCAGDMEQLEPKKLPSSD